MTLWIQNVGAADVASGRHFDCGENSMLIQISDPKLPAPQFSTPWFPTPKHKFKEIHQFQFLDELEGPHIITDEQAIEIVRLLKHALDNRMNVVVHCFAGVCRSGAVAEVGEMMGFVDADNFKIPNSTVKKKLMKVLGLTYD